MIRSSLIWGHINVLILIEIIYFRLRKCCGWRRITIKKCTTKWDVITKRDVIKNILDQFEHFENTLEICLWLVEWPSILQLANKMLDAKSSSSGIMTDISVIFLEIWVPDLSQKVSEPLWTFFHLKIISLIM